MAKPAQTGPVCRKLTQTAHFVYGKRVSVQIEKADRGDLNSSPVDKRLATSPSYDGTCS